MLFCTGDDSDIPEVFSPDSAGAASVYDEEEMQLDRLFEEDDESDRDDHTEGANDPGVAARLANALQDIRGTEQEERPRAQSHNSQVSGRDAASGRNRRRNRRKRYRPYGNVTVSKEII